SVTGPGGMTYALTPGVNSTSQVADSFYDASKCHGCTNIDATGEPSTSYFYSATNPPMSSWDFDNVWTANAGAFPTLR
ncbi:MAG: hypothetical protein ACRENE_31800, partial [Polyangiaceae bacterium]